MPQETKKSLIASIGEIQQDLSLYLEKDQTMQMIKDNKVIKII